MSDLPKPISAEQLTRKQEGRLAARLHERTGWTFSRCRHFIAKRYDEARSLCLLTGRALTYAALADELTALAADEAE